MRAWRTIPAVLVLASCGISGSDTTLDLAQALESGDWVVRAHAIVELGHRGQDLDEIAAALSDEAWQVRQQALVALHRHPGPEAARAVAAALADVDARVRARALRTLADMPQEAAASAAVISERLGDEDLQPRRWAAVVLSRIGPPAVPTLVEALAAESPEIRYRAAWALGAIGTDARAAAPVLRALTGDPSERVRIEALTALEAIEAR